jgi:SAM-dependent methyltransferase
VIRPSHRFNAFGVIYRFNRWNGTETRSGPGSTMGSTSTLRRILPEFCEGVGATSVLDLGCGASFWMPDLPGYLGIEIVPEALDAISNHFPDRTYQQGDIVSDELPHADVVIARDVLAHLPIADVLAVLGNIRASGATWALLTTFEDARNTADARPGGYHEYDLERDPYSIGEPWMVIEDGKWEDEVIYPTKYLGVWSCGW